MAMLSKGSPAACDVLSLAAACREEELGRRRERRPVNVKLMESRAGKMRLEEEDKKGSPGSGSTLLR